MVPPAGGSRGRRVATGVAVWLLVASAVRAVVLLPERCPPAGATDVRAAAGALVGWIDRNLGPDGRFLYRYDRATAAVVHGYNLVRHAGTLTALYQAAAAGHPRAQAAADHALGYVLRDRLVERDGWAAVAEAGQPASTGATALTVTALAARRQLTGDRRHDPLLARLGRFLLSMQEPTGAVLATWDPRTGAPVPGDYSVFFTGEAAWALARLHTTFPAGGWDEPALATLRYLAGDRDRAEGRFPPTSDHWAAYAIAEVATAWPGGAERLGAVEGYASRLAGIFGIQARWLAQRGDARGWRRIVRGSDALGAGEGTVGEGATQLWRAADDLDALDAVGAEVAARAACVAGRLVARVETAASAAAWAEPDRVRGAIFTADHTQVDDQQHALAALVAVEPLLAGGSAP